MVNLIPRLVLDENEVSKIVDNDCDRNSVGDIKSNDKLRYHQKKAIDDSSGKMDTELSLLMKAWPITVSLTKVSRIAQRIRPQVTMELSATLSYFVGNIPFTLGKLQKTITTLTAIGQKMIATSIPSRVNVFGGLRQPELRQPDTFKWRHLLCVLVVMILCPLVGEVVFILPMNSVDQGPDENKVFIYGIMTLYQLFMQVPWVETCNFAMPQVNIFLHARLVALLAGLIIAKSIDLVLTMGIFTYEPIFPIPFSILITGALGTLPAVPILYIMTPHTKRELGNFPLMFTLLIAYWAALLVVVGWAIGIQRLQGKSLQYLVLFSYALLRFGCKVLLCANISTRLESTRHIQLNLVVDILFTRVQVATWPFIDSPFTLMALFASESSVILWRYYDGVDRIQLWWSAILTTVSTEQNPDNVSKTRKVKDITEACFMASNQYIINMSLSEDKKDVMHNLTTCKTSSTLYDSSSTPSNGTAKYHYRTDICANEEPCSLFQCKRDQSVLLESLSTLKNSMIMCNGVEEGNTPESTHFGVIGQRLSDIHFLTFHKDSEDDDSSAMLMVEENSLASIFRNTVDDDAIKDVDIRNKSTDRVYGTEFRDEESPTPPPTAQENWLQRDLYHMVDSTGSLCVNIIVRINQELIFLAVKNLPSSEHLNESFQISDERWREAQIYGSIYIILMLLLVIGINFSSVFFSKKKGLDGKKLSLGRILSYLFANNFWHFFFWLISTGALVSSAMVNHFGADFSMHFKYLSCLDEIEWPGCSSD